MVPVKWLAVAIGFAALLAALYVIRYVPTSPTQIAARGILALICLAAASVVGSIGKS
jgi:hypothetical protein